MRAITLNLPSYRELGLVTLNLLRELLTKCSLGQHPYSKQLRKLIVGQG